MRPFVGWFVFALLPLVGCRPTPPTAPDAMLTEQPSAVAPAAPSAGGRAGTFTGIQGHSATGGVALSVANGIATLVFDARFSATPVPDPYVYVADMADANSGRRLRVARLVSSTGTQSYRFALPNDSAYTHVLVWCDRYNVGVADAMLR